MTKMMLTTAKTRRKKRSLRPLLHITPNHLSLTLFHPEAMGLHLRVFVVDEEVAVAVEAVTVEKRRGNGMLPLSVNPEVLVSWDPVHT